MRSPAAQHGVDSGGGLPSAFRERTGGGPAHSQVVDAEPAVAETGAVFARGLVPGLVGQDNPAAAIQHADAFGKRVEGHLNEFVGLNGLT